MSYELFKMNGEIRIFSECQHFTPEDINSLWEEHKIVYRQGVMAAWVEERKDSNPLIHLMQEDDGQIFWDKDKDVCFDSFWLTNYIETLSEVRDKIKNNP